MLRLTFSTPLLILELDMLIRFARASAGCLILLTLLLAGCGEKTSAPQPAAESSGAVKQRRVAKTAAVKGASTEAAENFADRLSQAIQGGDAAAVYRLLDFGAMFDRAADGLPFSSKVKLDVRQGFLKGVRGSGLVEQIITAPQSGGSYALLRVHSKRGKPHALFRMVSEAGINYHDFEVVEQGDAAVAADIYVYLTGEMMSQTFRRNLIPISAQVSRNWLQKLTLSETSFVKHIDDIQAMTNHSQGGRPREAIRVYKSLPADLRKDKNVLLIRHQAATALLLQDEQEVLDAITDFRKYHPNDVCIDFLMIDAFALQKEYDKAIEAIDRFDKAVGKDPYLNVLRANMLLEKGDGAAAIRAARLAVEGAPEAPDSHWTFIGLGLQLGDHATVYDGLTSIERTHNQQFGDLRDVAEYAGFVKSPEGARWLAEHGFTDAAP